MIDNESIVLDIQSGRDPAQNILNLWNNNSGIVHRLILPYSKKYEYDDLKQECFLALYDAVKGYNSAEGKFITYYLIWAKNRIFEYIYACSPVTVPNNLQNKIHQYKRLERIFETSYNRKPTNIEYMVYLKVNNSELRNIEKACRLASVRSLDAEYETAEDGSACCLLDAIPDSTDEYAEVIDRVNNEQLSDLLSDALSAIDKKQADSIRLHYYDDMTYKEIGAALGLSVEGVRQYIRNGMCAIRRGKYSRRLKDYIELQYSYAYKDSLSHYRHTQSSVTEQSALNILLACGM